MEFVRSIFRGASSAAKAKKVNKVLRILLRKKQVKPRKILSANFLSTFLFPKEDQFMLKKMALEEPSKRVVLTLQS